MSGLCREGSVFTLCCLVDIAEGLYFSYTIENSEVGKEATFKQHRPTRLQGRGACRYLTGGTNR